MSFLTSVLGSLHYGNYVGYEWTGGKTGEEKNYDADPVDGVDLAAKNHDAGYEAAETQYKNDRENGVPEATALARKNAALFAVDLRFDLESLTNPIGSPMDIPVRALAVPAITFRAIEHFVKAVFWSVVDLFDGQTPPPEEKAHWSKVKEVQDEIAPPEVPSGSNGPAGSPGKSSDNAFDPAPEFGGQYGWAGNTGYESTAYAPIALDLNKNGLELVDISESTAFYDITGNGFRNHVGWVAASDALLAYDKNEDGVICDLNEISFVSYVENAQTDLQGLAAFDTNSNGALDEGDEAFGKFRVWQDMDQDGESDDGELKSLTEAGIVSISLTSDEIVREDDSNTIYGIGEYAAMGEYGEEQGITGAFADVSLAYSSYGFQELLNGSIIIRDSDAEKTYVSAEDDDADQIVDLTDSLYKGWISGAGNDSLSAGGRKDVMLSGEDGDDTITGGDGDDWLAGGEGTDSISGGAGHDIIFFDDLDAIDGGDGFDIGFVTSAVAMSMDLYTHHLEAIIGNAADDSFRTSGSSSVYMDGGGGDDTLLGGIGSDILAGGLGNDSIQGGGGDDWIFIDSEDNLDNISGGDGDDILVIQDDIGVAVNASALSVESVYGGLGNDTITASGNNSITIDAGAGDDVISGGSANDILLGGSGNDRIKGNVGDDVLDGWTGDDTLTGGLGDDIYIFGHGRGNDVIDNSGDGRDAVWFAEDVYFEDVDFTQSDRDLVVRLTTTGETLTILDWFNNGRQLNTFLFSAYDFNDPAVTYLSTDGADALQLMGNLSQGLFAFKGNDTIIGDNADNFIDGGEGDDSLTGMEGDDTLSGGAGADTLAGGAGEDFLSYSTSNMGVTVNIGNNTASGGHAVGDKISGFENLIGSEYNDFLTGSTADNILDGRNGDDVLLGMGGNDVLVGGLGNDSLMGGNDHDTLGGGSGDDTLEGEAGDDILIGDDGNDCLYGGTGNDSLNGSTGNDILFGDDGKDILVGDIGNDSLDGGLGDDTLFGNAGNDTIRGGDGNDTMVGESGSDLLDGGAGSDTASYAISNGAVTIDLSTSFTKGGHAAGDTLVGIENIIGSKYNDSLTGDDLDNRFDGGSGNDTLTGGLGNDTLKGGTGDDTAIFDGPLDEYTISFDHGDLLVAHTLSGDIDTLNSIEHLTFQDASITKTGSISMLADQSVSGQFQSDGTNATYSVEQGPTNGTFSINADGTYSYTPDAGFAGTDGFIYRLVDENGVVSFGYMDVDIRPVADGDTFVANPSNAGNQYSVAGTALDGGGFVAVWRDVSGMDGAANGVFGQRYDNYGNAVGDEFQVNSSYLSHQYQPTITSLASGGFVVAWRDDSGQDGAGAGVFAQCFSAEGSKIGTEFQVNTESASAQYEPSVGRLADGGFVIAWRDDGARDGDADTAGAGVFAQRFDADGNAVGSEFQVNTYFASTQYDPSVIGLKDGGYVIAWDSNGRDGSKFGVYAQRYDAYGYPVKDEFKISSYASSNQRQVSLAALEDGGFVAVWGDDSGHDGSGWGVFGQRFAADGTPVGEEFLVNTTTTSTQYSPSVSALADGGFVAIWHDVDNTAVFQRFDADGNAVGGEIRSIGHQIATQDYIDTPVIVELSDGQLAVLSASVVGGQWEVQAKLYAAESHVMEGTSGNDILSGGAGNDTLSGDAGQDYLYGQGGDDLLSGGEGADVIDGGDGVDAISYASSEEGVTVDLNAGTGSGGQAEGDSLTNVEDIIGSSHSDMLTGNEQDNTLTGGEGNDTLTGGAGNDALSGGAGNDTVTFTGALADYTVTQDGADITVVNNSTSETDTLTDVEILKFGETEYAAENFAYATDGVITMLAEQTVAGRLDDPSDAGSITYTMHEGPQHGILTVNTDGTYSYVADVGYIGTDSFSFQAVDSNGIANIGHMQVDVRPIEDGEAFVANPTNTGNQYTVAATALDGGGFVAVWRDTSGLDGSASGVFGQIYDNYGNAIGGEFQVNSGYLSSQLEPTITSLADGGFVVAWRDDSGGDGAGVGVFGQRYDLDGNKVGTEFQVNTEPASSQYEPSIGSLADGGFVIAWRDDGARDGSTQSVYAQQFDASGNKVGTEFQVNTYSTNTQYDPSVVGLKDGGYVIAWDSNGQDGSQYGVYAQRYEANGDPVQGEFRINSHLTNNQRQVSLAALDDGGFMAVWGDNSGHDGSGWGVFGQRFDADGNPVGEEFLINSTTTSTQYSPSVTALADGGFVAIWHDADNTAVYQRFDGEGNAVSGEVRSLGHQVATQDYIDVPVIVELSDGQLAVLSASVVDGQWEVQAKLYAAESHVMNGTSGNDVLSGGLSNDTLSGDKGQDYLYGQGGDDQINGGEGADVIDGGSGVDTVSYAASEEGVTIDLDAGTGLGGQAEGDVLANVENVIGSSHSDMLTGNEESNVLTGGDGNDTLTGGSGNDTLAGGAGEDVAVFSEALVNYDITLDGNQTVIKHLVTGEEDTLSDVEQLRFDGIAYGRDDFAYTPNGQITLLQNDADGVVGSLNESTFTGDVEFGVYEGPQHGLLTINSDGTYNYTPDIGYTGSDSFSYQIVDGNIATIGYMDIDVRSVEDSDTFVANPSNAGNQYSVVGAALDGGGFVAVWRDVSGLDGAANGVFGQVYDNYGNAVGDEFQVNSSYLGQQYQPTITSLEGGGFVVAWRDDSGQDGDGVGVFAQRFNAEGNRVGMEFQVNSEVTGTQAEPSVARLADGGFVIAWSDDSGRDDESGTAGLGIFAQRYAADGNRVGSEFQVNTYFSSTQYDPSVIGLKDGGYVIAWDSYGRDGSKYGVFAQRYDSDGYPVKDEFKISSYSSSNQRQVSLAALEDGGFVAVWGDDSAHDGSGWGVFGQRFDAEGTPVGGEFLVNTTTTSTQYSPSVSALADGGFVAIWHNADNTAVYQRFDSDGNTVGGEVKSIGHQIPTSDYIDVPVIVELSDGQLAVLSAIPVSGQWEVQAKLYAAESHVMDGTSGNDILSGGTDNDTLSGEAGHDYLYGLGGDDLLSGGDGADVINGGTGSDTVSYASSEEGVTVNLAAGTGMGGSAEGDALTGIENVMGSSHSDMLTGNDEANVLTGGEGNDALTGGAGNDTLVGGEGDDTAVFDGTLADFTVTQDGTNITVLSSLNGEIDTLTDVEHLKFGDTVYNTTDFAYAVDGSIIMLAEQTVAGRLDDPADMGSSTYSTHEGPQHGTLSVNTDGTYTYVADAGYTGTDSFSFQALDSNGIANIGHMQVDVRPVEDGTAFVANPTNTGNQYTVAATALDGGGFVAVWRDDSGADGSGLGVMGQRYDNYGNAVGGEFQVNTSYLSSQYEPTITSLADGGFVVAWRDTSGGDGAGAGVFGQRYDSDGNKVGTEFQVNTESASAQYEPSVGSLADGGFVIAWRDDGARDGAAQSVYAQQFDAYGNKVGTEFQVNTYSASTQYDPSVIGLKDGSYVIAWDSNGRDGSGYSVCAQRYDASGEPVNGEFQINSHAASNQRQVKLAALDDGGFVAVWGDDSAHDGSGWGVYLQCFDTDGTPQRGCRVNTTTTSTQYQPSVTSLPDGGFAVIWHNSDNTAVFRQFDATGHAVGGEITALGHNVSTPDYTSAPVIISLSDGQLATLSALTVNGQWEIQAKLYAAVSHEMNGTSGNDVLSGGSGNDNLSGDTGHDYLYGQGGDDLLKGGDGADTLDGGDGVDTVSYASSEEGITVDLATGTGVGGSAEGDVLSSVENVTGSSHSDMLTGNEQDNVLTGGEGNDILTGGTGDDTLAGGTGDDTAVFDGTLGDYTVTQDGGDITVSNNSTGETDTLTDMEHLQFGATVYDITDFAYATDGVVVMLAEQTVAGRLDDPADMGSIIYSTHEDPQHGTLTVNMDGTYTYVADVGYTGTDSFSFKAVDSNGIANVGHMQVDVRPVEDREAFVVTPTVTGNQNTVAATALPGGGLVAVWRDTTGRDGSGTGVMGQRYDNYGNRVGSEFRVNWGQIGSQYEPTISSLTDGGFVVAWRDDSGRDGDGVGVFGQRYDSDGNTVGAEFQVNTESASSQYEPSIGSLADGGFVIAWRDDGARDGSAQSIFAQQFDAQGNKVSTEFQVNTYYSSTQYDPSVIGLKDGGYVIAWDSNGQDGSQYGVYAQRYDANGEPVNDEFQINSHITNNQRQVSLAALEDGGFIAVWADNSGHDGSGWGVFGQRFGADGTPVDGEFLVNTTTTSTQYSPSVTALADGGFVAIWHDVDNTAVYQRYDCDGNAVGGEIRSLGHQIATQDYNDSPVIVELSDGQLAVLSSSIVGGQWDVQAKLYAAESHVVEGTSGNDVLSGGTGNDTLSGENGQDYLYGQGGDDSLTGGEGADMIDGGDGVDTVSYSSSEAGVTIDLGAGTGLGGLAQGDTLVNVENVIGSAFADILTGNDEANILSGGEGNDTLTGGAGNDTLLGGAGDDIAVFTGILADYEVTLYESGIRLKHIATGETNTLVDIEQLQFDSATFATEDFASAPQGVISTLVNNSASGCLEGYGSSLVFSLVKGPEHGSIEINTDGTYTFTPAAEFSGTDSITYQTIDAYGVGVVSHLDVNVGYWGLDGDNVSTGGAGNDLLTGSSSLVPEYMVENSITLDGDDALSWKPSEAGDSTKFTFSAWVGGDGAAPQGVLFSAGTDENNYSRLSILEDGRISFTQATNGVVQISLSSAESLSTEGWSNVVLSYDSGNAAGTERTKISVNGQELVLTGTMASRNLASFCNAQDVLHGIGMQPGQGADFVGSIADVHLVDGQALSAEAFGAYDAGTDSWQPLVEIPERPAWSEDLCVGGTVSCSSQNTTKWAAELAFNDTLDGFLWLPATQGPGDHWLGYTLTDQKTVNRYSIGASTRSDGCVTYQPKDWTLRGFNEATGVWDILDTVTGQTNWGIGERRYYDIPENETAYSQYRIYPTANNGAAHYGIGEVELFEQAGTLTYGTNGFHLDFEDADSLGKNSGDIDGTDWNNWTVSGDPAQSDATPTQIAFDTLGNDTLTGGAGDDTLYGLGGDDLLKGGTGADVLDGGDGNDTYLFNRDDDRDVVSETGGNDTILFGSGIDEYDLWFSQNGNDLTIGVIGTDDNVRITNWYADQASHIETFELSDGAVLLESQVQLLVDAMSSYTPTAPGILTVPDTIQEDAQTTIAANWVRN